MAGVWILAENRTHTLELLNIGRHLAAQLDTKLSVLLRQDGDPAEDFIAYGADEILLLPSIAEDQSLDAYIPVIVDEARKEDPDIFLIAASMQGKDMAARIATRLNTGLCSECIALHLADDGTTLEMERLAYGGAAVQKVSCITRPVMATIPPKTYEPASQDSPGEGTMRTLSAPAPSPLRVLERKPKEARSQDITEAKVIVCVGRGITQEEDLALARELAAALGGEIGCTRPISEEMHWLPEDLCIGLSGIAVAPDLYVGLGVSGQVQHLTGIRDAKIICAVNKDDNAPIFDAADYGITGDLYEVVPALIEEIKKATTA